MASESKPEYQGKSFVLRGQFSPVVFQPDWFVKAKLLKASEAADAEIEAVTKEITAFSTEWLRFQVLTDRLYTATAEVTFYEPLRDLTLGMIELLAVGLPVRLLGMNHDFHFRVENEKMWHKIGHTLAPKERWQPLSGKKLGLQTLTIEGEREDQLEGYLLAKVEPSSRFNKEDDEYGVYVHINDHIVVSSKENPPVPESARTTTEIIATHWETSAKRAAKVADSIMELANRK